MQRSLSATWLPAGSQKPPCGQPHPPTQPRPPPRPPNTTSLPTRGSGWHWALPQARTGEGVGLRSVWSGQPPCPCPRVSVPPRGCIRRRPTPGLPLLCPRASGWRRQPHPLEARRRKWRPFRGTCAPGSGRLGGRRGRVRGASPRHPTDGGTGAV